MATKSVTGTAQAPDGSARKGALVVATLSQQTVITGTSEIVPSRVTTTTSVVDGTYSLTLQATNDMTPNNTFYSVVIAALDGGSASYTIQVPQTAGPFEISTITTSTPTASPTPSHVSTLTVDGQATFNGPGTHTGIETFSNGLTGRVLDWGGWVYHVKSTLNPGGAAHGDARWVADAGITIALKIITSATANFTAADVGRSYLIAGAGPSGGELGGTILSVQSGTQATGDTAATATVSGANAFFANDDSQEVIAAVDAQQVNGGKVALGPGSFYLFSGFFPCPQHPLGTFFDATRPLFIEGAGMLNTALLGSGQFVTNGLIGYPGSPGKIMAQVIMSDITLDGNYAGQGGTTPQCSGSAGALLSIFWPFTNPFASPTSPTGQYHVFTRVRFYRDTGFNCQPAKGLLLDDCVFDKTGQPDVASGGLHWDNIGSDIGDAIAIGCTFKDSSGNYADFIDTVGGAGHISRFVMMGCVSRNHQIGGIYACSNGSIIALNRLINSVTGSGIGYDSGAQTNIRAKNLVALNVLDKITVNTSGLSFALYGDMVFGNIAQDSYANDFLQGPPNLSQIVGNFNSPVIEANFVYGDKLALYSNGVGQHRGFGAQSQALVVFLPNLAGERFSLRLDAGGAAQASSGGEIFGFTSANHFAIANAAAPVSSTLGANVTSVTASGGDTMGTIAVVMSGALAANTKIATLTFNASFGAAAPFILLTNQTRGAGLADVNPYVLANSTGVSFDLACNQSLAAGTYTFGYLAFGPSGAS